LEVKGAPISAFEAADTIDTIVKVVDQRGREMDERWGFGRLPTLVPIDIADRFRLQRRKFSAAIWERNVDDAVKHGEAMIRAYAKLDEIASATGADTKPVEQWEFDTPDGLIVLIRDLADAGRVQLHGRQAQVWSLDEIASVIRAHPMIIAAKQAFPGAEVETVRPPLDVKQALNDELMELPF
jgi:hypothetical protein